MEIQKAKNWYDELVKGGELFEMFPTLSGQWKEDEHTFIEIYAEFDIEEHPIDEYDDFDEPAY